jgi:hypothetical protein
MVDSEMEKIVNKPLKLWAVDRAREQVRQLVRGLNGAPARPGKRRRAAEFHRYLLFGIAS